VATAQRQQTAALSTTEQSVLGLLLTYGEHSGYDLKRAAEAGVGYVWTAAKSHVYAVLPRLVEGGYATVRTVTQERRPDKHVYQITKKGEEAFRRWLEEPVDERAGSRSPFLLKVFFGGRMSREALVAHVERRRAEAAKELAEYREIEEHIRGDEQSYYGYVTLRWGLAQSEAWIRWADDILGELAER
jgi:PadR family transcriptional regulator, regulatory protein AphA